MMSRVADTLLNIMCNKTSSKEGYENGDHDIDTGMKRVLMYVLWAIVGTHNWWWSLYYPDLMNQHSMKLNIKYCKIWLGDGLGQFAYINHKARNALIKGHEYLPGIKHGL